MVSDVGKETPLREEQLAKAESPISCNPSFNVNDDNEALPEKALSPMLVMFPGIVRL